MRLVPVKPAVCWKAETVRTKIAPYKDEKNPTPRIGFCEWFLHMCGKRECFSDFIVLFHETINGTVNKKLCILCRLKSSITQERLVNLPVGVSVMAFCLQKIDAPITVAGTGYS